MTSILHIVEPTLHDEAGHCAALASSLANAAGDAEPHVWMRRDASPGLMPAGAVEHRVFPERLRRLGAMLVYRRLLERAAAGEPVLLSTATTSDLVLLDLASRTVRGGAIRRGAFVWAFVHWINLSPRKERLLKRLARRHPGLEIVCSTQRVREVFSAAGFARVHMVGYPGVGSGDAPYAGAFRHVLYAGAARRDKGFAAIVDLVAHLHATGSSIPITVQCSPTHRGRHEPGIAADIERMRHLGYGSLTLLEHTLDGAAYRALFDGAITVQAYDPAAFADRISGVTLDALRAGSPIIVPRGTWLARRIEGFGAGVTLDDPRSPRALAQAVETIRGAWPEYSAGAARAWAETAREDGAGTLVRLVRSGGSRG